MIIYRGYLDPTIGYICSNLKYKPYNKYKIYVSEK